jgi:hypothetical protein
VWTYKGRVAFVLSVTEKGMPVVDGIKLQRLRQLVLGIMTRRAPASHASSGGGSRGTDDSSSSNGGALALPGDGAGGAAGGGLLGVSSGVIVNIRKVGPAGGAKRVFLFMSFVLSTF